MATFARDHAISLSTVRAMIRDGRLSAVKIGQGGACTPRRPERRAGGGSLYAGGEKLECHHVFRYEDPARSDPLKPKEKQGHRRNHGPAPEEKSRQGSGVSVFHRSMHS